MVVLISKFIRSLAKYSSDMLAKTKITPNQITCFGFLVNCGVAYLIAKGQFSYLILGLLIWVAGLFDVIDGSLARNTGRATVFGEFLDSVLDRYSDAVIYFGVAIHFLELGRTNYVILIMIAMIGSFVVSYTRAKAESLDRECEVGLMPRAVRIIILGISFCVGQIFWGLLIIAILSNVTATQRIFHVYKKLINN